MSENDPNGSWLGLCDEGVFCAATRANVTGHALSYFLDTFVFWLAGFLDTISLEYRYSIYRSDLRLCS